MNTPPPSDHAAGATYAPWRHRFSILLACSTALLILWGAMVTSKDAGLSVPDWPTAYGYWWLPIDKWIGNIWWEHTHRLVAATIGFLTLSLAIWTAFAERRFWVRILAAAALCVVVVQGILGGITVYYRLPVAVSSMHATLAQLFFCMTITLAFVTSRGFVERTARPHGVPLRPLRRLAAVALAAILAQLVLGAVMRHSNSGLAVPDFPTAYGGVVPGQIIPALDDASIASYNRYLRSKDLDTYDEAEFRTSRERILIHMAHRLWAFVVLAIVLTLAGRLLRRHGADRMLWWGGVALIALIAWQFTLGIFTVWSHKNPFLTSLHVVFGAITLGTTYLVALRAWQLGGQAAPAAVAAPSAPATRPAPTGREVTA